ncbi:uncharacterized protein LOC120350277 [Nilaparvata lugens]|uniref:uncharacterized protein LOC120350277 n=1 Tax=Nilaparvata lugens TaxID=108931 RepID=UPI00193D16B8|nr:uncharacterized protein LOC120350277 [Nilaparvata lugens]
MVYKQMKCEQNYHLHQSQIRAYSTSLIIRDEFVIIINPPPHEHILNYWEQKAALAADASAAAPAPSPLTVEPPSPGEIMLGDSPVQHLAPPATWAPQRVVPTTLTNNNNMKQKQGKRRLVFDEPEVSGDEDETIFSQTKDSNPESYA